jgi:phage-related baseplate assembly protein
MMLRRQRFAWFAPIALAAITFLFVARFLPTPKPSQPNAPGESSTTSSRADDNSLRPIGDSDIPASSVSSDPALEQWQELSRQGVADANSAARKQAMCAALEDLAARNPTNALSLALGQTDEALRGDLLQAVLRGWASAAPDDAANWARSQTHLEQGQSMSAVFNGAAKRPDEAVRLGQRLSAEDPENASSYGGYLIFALSRAEKFEAAAAVAMAAPTEFRTDLLTIAYNNWGQRQPKLALAAAAALSDSDMQRTAFQATVGGWAKANPRELTEIAMTLPDGPDRKLALTTALRQWIDQDPASAAEWARNAKFFPEMEATLED